jgi:hypothetical protein
MTITTEAAPAGQMNGGAPPAAGAADRPGADQPADAPPAKSDRVSGRLTVINPGKPPMPLSDDIDLEDMLALLDPGGYALVRRDPHGPPVSFVLPIDDPRPKLIDAGVRMARRGICRQPAPPPAPAVVIQTMSIETVHVHGTAPAGLVEQIRTP